MGDTVGRIKQALDTVGRIEQLTERVRSELEQRHGFMATLSPEFERRVRDEVDRRMSEARELVGVKLTDEERETLRRAAGVADADDLSIDPTPLIRIIERLTGERFLREGRGGE